MKRTQNGFTLVELLVVITIIGILAGLISAAAVAARRTTKNGVIVMEVKQLEMACQAYKESRGEYPPDFAGEPGQTWGTAARAAILRHLAKAFPRYVPGVSTNGALKDWDGFRADVLGNQPKNIPGYVGWNLDVNTLSPAGAMAFWLGGKPAWLVRPDKTLILPGNADFVSTKPVTAFGGFSANVANPFDNSPSRIQPFFEFNLMCLKYLAAEGIMLWPDAACDQDTSPIVYFRAENDSYHSTGGSNPPKCWTPASAPWVSVGVTPAIDSRLSGSASTTWKWINPKSIQIFSAGLDAKYGCPKGNKRVRVPLHFPSGDNYDPANFDDITNFSGGTLENAIPQ